MKIVVLDGYTANPGDLSWDGLSGLGEVTIYDRTTPDQLPERAKGAEVLLTNKTILDASMISLLPDLRYIGVLATGYNVVDIEAARGRGIAVTNVAGYSTEAVAQMVFALLLEFCRRSGTHAASVARGDWEAAVDFSYTLSPQLELTGKRMGIFGLGSIGRAVARIALAFGMEVVATNRSGAGMAGVTLVDRVTLFATSDVISLHAPLSPETTRIINAGTIEQMRDGVVIVNTGRGGLVDEAALAEALKSGKVGGACLDVLEQEPPGKGSPLIGAPNTLITPHIAWATREARSRLLKEVRENLAAFVRGESRNRVV